MKSILRKFRKCLLTSLLGLLGSVTCFQSVQAAVPQMHLSGHPWNSGVFTKGNGDVPSVAAFASWRGKPVDSILWFATRDNWANFDNDVPADVINFAGIKVLSFPTHPDSLGWAGLDQVAAGTYNSNWRSIGAYLVSSGLNNNRTVLRIGWEMNGNWWDWSATSSGEYGDRRQTFKNAYINIVNSIRAGGANAVQFDWCVNKGDQGSAPPLFLPTDAWGSYPGDAYVDILGVDFYDFFSPSYTDAQFNSEAAKVASLNDITAYCTAHGKQIALDEWGVAHDDDDGVGVDGGDDNPFFIQKIWNWLNAHSSIVAYESYFDAPDGNLEHTISPPEGPSWNPHSSALYQSLWGSAPAIPAAPTGLTAIAGSAQVALSWTAATGASSYNVYRGTSAGGENTTAIATGIASANYTVTGLTNGTPYYFKVKAVNSGGTSGYSNEANATPIAALGNVHSGTWAAKGIIPTTATWIAIYQEPTCAQNKAYTASVWVKGSGNFVIKLLDGNWTQISQTSFSASATWTQKTVTFTTPNTTNPGVIFYIADAGGGGTLYIDDAFMGVNGGTNVLANPGFESGNTVWTVGSPVWSIVHNP